MNDNIIDELSTDQLVTVVELQQVELNRLLAEQKRLNERVDKLLALQEREQVLRQQMQASLDRLGAQYIGVTKQEAPTKDQNLPLLADRLHQAEHRYQALRGAMKQLVIVLERQRSR